MALQPHVTASFAGEVTTRVAQSNSSNDPSPPALLQFPASKPMQNSIPSVASRKALLLEKLQGASQGSTPSTPKSQPWTPPVLSQPDWSKLVLERRERKDTLASTTSCTTLPAKLSPMPTGSTVASTAVDPTGLALGGCGNGLLEPTTRLSSVSRVRLAVMAINAMDKSVENAPAWRVGRTEEGPPSRSWSRMSGAGRFGDDKQEISWVSVDETEEEYEAPSLVKSSSSETLESEPSLSVDVTSSTREEGPASSTKNFGESHVDDQPDEVPTDTHPPDMVSPRTGLAYVMLPPWARRRSSVDFDTQPKSVPTPTTARPQSLTLEDSDTEEDDEVAPLPTPTFEKPQPPQAFTPADSSANDPPKVPTQTPKPFVRRDAPVVLRGTAKPPPTVAPRKPLISSGPRHPTPLPQTARPRPHNRSVSLTPSHPPSAFPKRFAPQPVTTFWSPPERLRQRRASFSMPAIPDEPLALRAQNAVPLRKVQTKPTPKPMRFSMAF